jgi:hypothetical protein
MPRHSLVIMLHMLCLFAFVVLTMISKDVIVVKLFFSLSLVCCIMLSG